MHVILIPEDHDHPLSPAHVAGGSGSSFLRCRWRVELRFGPVSFGVHEVLRVRERERGVISPFRFVVLFFSSFLGALSIELTSSSSETMPSFACKSSARSMGKRSVMTMIDKEENERASMTKGVDAITSRNRALYRISFHALPSSRVAHYDETNALCDGGGQFDRERNAEHQRTNSQRLPLVLHRRRPRRACPIDSPTLERLLCFGVQGS